MHILTQPVNKGKHSLELFGCLLRGIYCGINEILCFIGTVRARMGHAVLSISQTPWLADLG